MLARTAFIYSAALAMDVGFFCAWAAVPFLVRQGGNMDLSDGALGMLRALAAATYIFGTFILAKHWDGRDRERLARWVAGGVGACIVLCAVSREPWLLFLWLPGAGLLLSMFWPNLMALVGDARHGDLARRIASFNCWWSTGKAVAFLFCGILLESLGDPGSVLVACGVLVLLVPPLIRPGPLRTSSEAPEAIEARGRTSMFKAALGLLFVGWFIGTSLEVHLPQGYGPRLFAGRFGDAYAFWVNALLFLMYLGSALAFYVMRLGSWWAGSSRLIVGSAGVLVLTQAGLALTGSPWLMAPLLVMAGATYSIAYAQSLFHAQAGRSDRSRRSGIHEGVLSLGTMVGPLTVGCLIDVIDDPTQVRWIAVVAAVLALVGVWHTLARARDQ